MQQFMLLDHHKSLTCNDISIKVKTQKNNVKFKKLNKPASKIA